MIGRSIYGVAVIDGSLYSRFYGIDQAGTSIEAIVFLTQM